MDNNSLVVTLTSLSADDVKALFGHMNGDILCKAWKNLQDDYACGIEVGILGATLWDYCIDEALSAVGLDRDKADVCFNYLCSEVYYSGEYTEEQRDKFESLTGFELQISDND